MNGIEWIVEAHGCDPLALADMSRLRRLFAHMVAEIGLCPVTDTQWHQFPSLSFDHPSSGGITGLCLLAESHLTVHTFPEHGSLCLNLFCCKPRTEWDFTANLKLEFRAESVEIRRLERHYASPLVQAGQRSGRR